MLNTANALFPQLAPMKTMGDAAGALILHADEQKMAR